MNNSKLALRYWDNPEKKQVHQRRIFSTPALIVELEGVEPSSAQGNHTLSTRLFQPLVFVHQQDLDHQLIPYPLNFTSAPRLTRAIPDLPAPLCQEDSEQHPLSDVSFSRLAGELS